MKTFEYFVTDCDPDELENVLSKYQSWEFIQLVVMNMPVPGFNRITGQQTMNIKTTFKLIFKREN